jgi:hypothetical protein
MLGVSCDGLQSFRGDLEEDAVHHFLASWETATGGRNSHSVDILLGMPARAEQTHVPPAEQDYRDRFEQLTGLALHHCPHCQQGRMLVVETLPAVAVRICTTDGLVLMGLLHLTRDLSAWQCQCGARVLLFRRLLEGAWSNNR